MHFNLGLIQFIAEHRNPLLTQFFLFCSFCGDTNGYIFIMTAIYVLWDKRLALRLVVLVLLTSLLNTYLKFLIKNPRPFVQQGTYLKRWAVPKLDAVGMAHDYSTPSGHAMDAGVFYAYLFAAINNRWVKAACVAAAVCIGISRPYLGVHYAEDILIGWAVGGLIAYGAIKYVDEITAAWARISYEQQVITVGLVSIVLSMLSRQIAGGHINGQTVALAEYLGFLTGVVIAQPLESKYINFDPKSSSNFAKGIRYVISIAFTIMTIAAFDKVFHRPSHEIPQLGYLVNYFRFAAAAIANIFIAPLVFTKLGLCDKFPGNVSATALDTAVVS